MTEKTTRRELFNYDDIIDRQTFTYDGCSVVFYEDTEKNEKRSFHSYMGGDLYMSRATPPKSKIFYCCDVYGNYIPRSIILENRKLKQMLKENPKPEFKTTLKTFIKEQNDN